MNQLDDICNRFDRPVQVLKVSAELGQAKKLDICILAFLKAFHMAENGVMRGNRDPKSHGGRRACHGRVPQAAARLLASRAAQNSPAYWNPRTLL